MPPILYRINYGSIKPSDRPGERLLPWFTDKLILCFWTGNWMRTYLNKHIEEIKLEAELKGFRFFWIEDANIGEFADLPIVSDHPTLTLNDQISYYLFDDRYTENVCLVRRLDNRHFVGWLKSDIVKSSMDIRLPKELYDELGHPEDYKPAITWEEIETISEEETASSPSRTDPDPNNDLHDHYFQQFSCYCETCGKTDTYKIPKDVDFYNIMESEARCARCKKDSRVISSGAIGYYLSSAYGGWHPRCVEIPSGTGYCEKCKPFYISDVGNLELRCDCGRIMIKQDDSLE